MNVLNSKVTTELSYEQKKAEYKAKAIEAAHMLRNSICGQLYDCDADDCPLEVVIGLCPSLRGNRCHIQRLLDDLEEM